MIELKQYRTDHGIKTVLVKEERTLLHILVMGEGKGGALTVLKVPKSEQRYMSDVIEQKKRRVIPWREFASFGHRNGATKEAKKFLKECRS